MHECMHAGNNLHMNRVSHITHAQKHNTHSPDSIHGCIVYAKTHTPACHMSSLTHTYMHSRVRSAANHGVTFRADARVCMLCVCVCVCVVCVCVCVVWCVCVCVCVSLCVWWSIHVCLYGCIYLFIHACMHGYMHTDVL